MSERCNERGEQMRMARELPISVLGKVLNEKAIRARNDNPRWWSEGQRVVLVGRIVAPKLVRPWGTEAKLRVESAAGRVHKIKIFSHARREDLLRLRGAAVCVGGSVSGGGYDSILVIERISVMSPACKGSSAGCNPGVGDG